VEARGGRGGPLSSNKREAIFAPRGGKEYEYVRKQHPDGWREEHFSPGEKKFRTEGKKGFYTIKMTEEQGVERHLKGRVKPKKGSQP